MCIRDSSRTIDKEKALDKENFSLSLLCESIIDELTLMAEDNGVRLSSNIQKDIEIDADETLIMRKMCIRDRILPPVLPFTLATKPV